MFTNGPKKTDFFSLHVPFFSRDFFKDRLYFFRGGRRVKPQTSVSNMDLKKVSRKDEYLF